MDVIVQPGWWPTGATASLRGGVRSAAGYKTSYFTHSYVPSYALAPDLCLVSNVRPEPPLVDVTSCDDYL